MTVTNQFRVTKRLAGLALGLLLPVGQATALDWYVGARAGIAALDKDSNAATQEIRALGESNVTLDVDKTSPGGSIYGGIAIDEMVGFELGLFTLGEHDTDVNGTTTNENLLANRVAAVQPRAGEGVSLAVRLNAPLIAGFEGRMRYGIAFWQYDFDINTSSGQRSFEDNGTSGLAGLGVWYSGFGALSVGVDADFYDINDDTVYLLTGGIEWRP